MALRGEITSTSLGPGAFRVPGAFLPVGQLRLWRASRTRNTDDWAVRCLLGEERPKVIRGYGGWAQTSREGRRAVATPGGSETPAYSITLRLDLYRPEFHSVEAQMRDLERLCGWNRPDDTLPPVVNFAANVAHDQDDEPDLEWLCESLDWGDAVANDFGLLLWQEATIVLGLDARAEVKDPGRAVFERRELGKGRTLREFARHWLGDPKRWKDVASLNVDNPRCPKSPDHEAKRAVTLLVPPREPRSKRGRS